MPCYDKKLEAVRPNFTLGDPSTAEVKEVDTVLATHELVDLISGLAAKSAQPPTIESFSLIPFFEYQSASESDLSVNPAA
jgi:iron only hydrogenase large subunit-like protein